MEIDEALAEAVALAEDFAKMENISLKEAFAQLFPRIGKRGYVK